MNHLGTQKLLRKLNVLYVKNSSESFLFCRRLLILYENRIGVEGARRLAVGLGQCPSLAELNLQHNFIDDRFIAMIETSIGDSNLLFANFQESREPDDDESDEV